MLPHQEGKELISLEARAMLLQAVIHLEIVQFPFSQLTCNNNSNLLSPRDLVSSPILEILSEGLDSFKQQLQEVVMAWVEEWEWEEAIRNKIHSRLDLVEGKWEVAWEWEWVEAWAWEVGL